jgi:hypothetical protein
MVNAAERGEEVRLPRYLPHLLRADLVSIIDGKLAVVSLIPPVPAEMRWRFPPDIAAQHADWVRANC